MTGTEPMKTKNEPELTKRPIAVTPASNDQRLSSMARLNFNKVYTVELNVKVMNVGFVTMDSMPFLLAYWRNTMEAP